MRELSVSVLGSAGHGWGCGKGCVWINGEVHAGDEGNLEPRTGDGERMRRKRDGNETHSPVYTIE